MTSGTVEFRQSEYNQGDTLLADFTWYDAHWNFTAEAFAILSIYNPVQALKTQSVITDNSEGGMPLSYVADSPGTWRARLRIWNGSSWTDLSHYTTVTSEEEPPIEPPPPSPNEWNLTFYTTPGNCLIQIYHTDSGYSDGAGYKKFFDLYEGGYTYYVSKDGYVTEQADFYLGNNKIIYVTLEEIEAPPETYTLIVNTIPTNCRVQVNDIWDTNSGDNGTVGIPDLAAGSYNVTVSKSGLTSKTVTVDLTGDDKVTVNITEAPDFWTDPIGWIQFFVISTMDTMLGWTGGTFVGLLNNIKAFFDNSWIQLSDFFSDISKGVKDALGSTLTNIQDWLDESFNNIGEWWDSTTADIGEWWNSTTQDMGEWWEGVSGDIGDWWTGSIEDLNAAISSATEGFLSWGEGLLTDIWEGIQGWVVDLITGLIESFNAGFDQGIEDQKTERGYNEE